MSEQDANNSSKRLQKLCESFEIKGGFWAPHQSHDKTTLDSQALRRI